LISVIELSERRSIHDMYFDEMKNLLLKDDEEESRREKGEEG